MKATIIKRDQVALFLAAGFTKKETANKLHKSENTVRRQADDFYKRTGCRNLADLTRFVISRYTGIHVNDIIIRAMQDITIGVAVGLFTWLITRPGALAEIAAGLQNWFK